MNTTENQTMNEVVGTELVKIGLYIQTAENEIDKAYGFITHDGKNWIVRVEILDPMDAFAPVVGV